VYGLAEATLAVCFPPPGRAPLVRRFDGSAIVSVGRPLPGYDVRIADDDGHASPEGVVGRIFVRGPSVMSGYIDDPDALASGWLDTGDRGFVIDDEIFIHGRAKDIIIVNGLKFAPERIEAAVDHVTGRVGSSAAIGVTRSSPSDGTDREVLAVLIERARPSGVPSPPSDADDEAVATAVRIRVGEWVALTPAIVCLLPHGSLPRTTSGKIRRGDARQQYTSGQLPARPRVSCILFDS
jgi:fatty-acyl-CoA synthase